MGALQFPQLDSAIVNAEGYGAPNYAYPNSNNPFDLQPGGVETTYPSYQAGLQAGDSMLANIAAGNSSMYSPSESLSQFGATYSGGDPNFAANLSKSLGVSPDTPMSQVFAASQSNQNNPQSFWGNVFDSYLNHQMSDPGNPFSSPSAPAYNAPGAKNWWTVWDPARWAFALVGLGLIIAGLIMFKTTGVIIEKTAGLAAKGAALAA